MKEINFRGFSQAHENKWVYGFLMYDPDGHPHICSYTPKFSLLSRKVARGSEAQYTGLKDENGIDIYDGDILECFNRNGEKMKYNYRVHWNDKLSAYYKTSISGQEELGLSLPVGVFVKAMIVIGNIYQNPELLK